MSGGYRTLIQITNEVANTFQDSSASRKARIKEAIQREYLNFCNKLPWPDLIRIEDDVISMAAGDKHFYTPYYMGNILGIFPSNQSLKMDPVQIASYLRRHGKLNDVSSNGWMSSYTFVGSFAHKEDIPSGEKMIFTPGTLDVAALTTISCTIHGVTNTDEKVEEVVCTNGAQVTTANSYTEVYSIATDAVNLDTLFVSGQLTVTVYARLPPGVHSVRYRKYRVGASPAEAKTLTVAYKKEPLPLMKDNQAPEIPVSDALYHSGLAELYRSMRKPGPIAQAEDAQAMDKVQAAFDETILQAETAPQASPIERYRMLPGKRF